MKAFEINSPISDTINLIEQQHANMFSAIDASTHSIYHSLGHAASALNAYQPAISTANASLSKAIEAIIPHQAVWASYNAQIANSVKVAAQAAFANIPDIGSMSKSMNTAVINSLSTVSKSVQEVLDADRHSDFFDIKQQLLSSGFPNFQLNIVAKSIQGIIDSEIGNDFVQDSIEDDFMNSEDEAENLVYELREAVNDNINWEQKLSLFISSYKDTHPVLTAILIRLIFFILAYFASLGLNSIFQINKDADVRCSPDAHSACIARLETGSEVLAIDEQPYYYMIKFSNPETGEEYEGWISKRSLTIKEIDEETLNEN